MIALINAPENLLTDVLSGPLDWYSTPLVQQEWQVFAPNPGARTYHVLARVRSSNNQIGAWYDVSQFFVADLRSDPLSPNWALAEGLDHALATVWSSDKVVSALSIRIVERSAAIVLTQGGKAGDAVALQIELQRQDTPDYDQRGKQLGYSNQRLPWVKFPSVEK